MRSDNCLARAGRMLPTVNMIVGCVRDLAEINHWKQGEYKRLYKCDEYTQQRQRQRDEKMRYRRIEIGNLPEYLLIRKHIRKKSNAQRKRADQIADDFDAENKTGHDKHVPRQPGSRKMRQVI